MKQKTHSTKWNWVIFTVVTIIINNCNQYNRWDKQNNTKYKKKIELNISINVKHLAETERIVSNFVVNLSVNLNYKSIFSNQGLKLNNYKF